MVVLPMSKGRKPLPTHLKLLKGTAQPCRINKNEPKPSSELIEMPSDLSAGAQKQWAVVVKQLKAAKIMTELDVHALAAYCEAYSRWREANNKIQELGCIVKSPNGYPVQSPYLQIANKAFEQMRAMLSEFGMTPSSRTKVTSSAHDQDGNPFSSF